MKKNILILVMLAFVFMLTGCGTTKINLNDYVSIEVSGYDGYGEATYDFDFEQLEADYGDKIKIKKMTEDMKIEAALGATPMDILHSYCIAYATGEYMNLKNGDVATFTWNCDAEDAKKYFNCELQYEDISKPVSGLETIPTFDPFEYITITFAGTSPYARAEYEISYDNPAMQYVYVEMVNPSNLKIGDTVIVNVNITNNISIEEFINKYGVIPERGERTFKVENVDYYLMDGSEVPQSVLDESYDDYMEYYLDYVEDYWENPETLQEVKYIGDYVLTQKSDSHKINQNYYYLIFKVLAKHPVTNETVEYYTYGYYKDVIVEGDNIHLGPGTAPSPGWGNKEYFEVDGVEYVGFETLDDLVDAHIQDKLKDYEIVENMLE